MEIFEKKYDLKSVKNSALKQYESAGIFDLSDLEWLLACCLGKNRTELKLIQEISKEDYKKIQNALKKRLQSVPVSKIFHSANFYGYDFYVNKNVLSPRNETEILVENALNELKNTKNPQVLDLCCGSGIIGITIKKKLPTTTVTCLDISPKALYVAHKNAKKHNVRVNFLKSNMFDLLKKDVAYDMIISNPPYIKTNDLVNLENEVLLNDPVIALDGGADGLKFYKILVDEGANHLKENGILLVEIGYNQSKQVTELFKINFKDIRVLKDYSGNDRVISARLKRKNDD